MNKIIRGSAYLSILLAGIFGVAHVSADENLNPVPLHAMQELQTQLCTTPDTFAQGYKWNATTNKYELQCIGVPEIQARLGIIEGGIVGCPAGQIAIGASTDKKILKCKAIVVDPCPITDAEVNEINALWAGTRMTKEQICQLTEVYIGPSLDNPYGPVYGHSEYANIPYAKKTTSWTQYSAGNILSTGFGKISSLKTIVLNGSVGSNLPQNISGLGNLETLVIANSNITALPTRLGNLKKLKTLKLINTQITAMPDSIGSGNLALEDVVLVNNPGLLSIGAGFGNLPVLKYLEIKNNGSLQYLPENFGDLGDTLLGSLSYGYRTGQWYSDPYGYNYGTKYIQRYEYNPVTGRNDKPVYNYSCYGAWNYNRVGNTTLDNGHTDQEAYYLGNFNVWSGTAYPGSLEACSNAYPQYSFSATGAIVSLDLSGNNLKKLPDSFSQMSRIRGLILSHNPLNESGNPGPIDAIGRLSNLEVLIVKNTKAPRLSTSIDYPVMRVFHVSENSEQFINTFCQTWHIYNGGCYQYGNGYSVTQGTLKSLGTVLSDMPIQEYSLQKNGLETLPIEVLRSLKEAKTSIRAQKIGEVNPYGPITLWNTTLDLRQNRLKSLPSLEYLPHVRSVNLDENLGFERFAGFGSDVLTDVSIKDSRLTQIPENLENGKITWINLSNTNSVFRGASADTRTSTSFANIDNQLTDANTIFRPGYQNLYYLDLSGNQFSTLPASISELKALRGITLNNMGARYEQMLGSAYASWILRTPSLKGLHSNIGQLDQLQYIRIENSRECAPANNTGAPVVCQYFDTIPTEINSLTRLNALTISGGALETLPQSLSGLTSLYTLNLDSNKLTASGIISLSNIPNLTNLSIKNNGITDLQIPDNSFNRLVEMIYTDGNPIASVSIGAGSLNGILQCSGCNIIAGVFPLIYNSPTLTSLSIGSGSLQTFKELKIHNNPLLTTVQFATGSMSSIQQINISKNAQLASLNIPQDSFQSASGLVISENPRLNQLTINASLPLLLSGAIITNTGLTSFAATPGSLTSLTTLNLNDNSITSFSAASGSLTSLTTLNLNNTLKQVCGEYGCFLIETIGSNALRDLTFESGSLTKLSQLQIQYNNMASIPSGITQISTLKSLLLGNNPLTTLPDTINQLTSLEFLSIHNAKLTTLPDTLSQLKLHSLSITKDVYSFFSGISYTPVSLTSLPDSFVNFTTLRSLGLSGNDQLGGLNKSFPASCIGTQSGITTSGESIQIDSPYNATNCVNDNNTQYIRISNDALACGLKQDEIDSLNTLIGSNLSDTQWCDTTTLSLSGKSLSSIPLGIRKLSKLDNLDLSYNNLTNTGSSAIQQGNFPSQRLSFVNLSYNNFVGSPRTTNLPANVTKLDLSHNNITQLTGQQHYIADNGNFPATISELDLSYNALSGAIHRSHFPQGIQKLNLSHNSITRFNYPWAQNNYYYTSYLTHLDLSYNQLSEYQGVNCTHQSDQCTGYLYESYIKYLDVSNNQITSFHLGNSISIWYTNLETLNISNNPIGYIDQYITKYTKLKSVNFTNLYGGGNSYFTNNTAVSIDPKIQRAFDAQSLSGSIVGDRSTWARYYGSNYTYGNNYYGSYTYDDIRSFTTGMHNLSISSQIVGTGSVLRFSQSVNYENTCGLTTAEIDELNNAKDIQFDGRYWCERTNIDLSYSPGRHYFYTDPATNALSTLLTNVPTGVWKLTQLRYLNLERQNIINIPSAISQLQSLQELSLCGNPLSSLPGEIGSLTNLEILKLSNTSCGLATSGMMISTLPIEIGNLKKLHTIFINGMGLDRLGEGFGGLTALSGALNLSNNRLVNIDHLPLAPKVTSLNISHNLIQNIGDDIDNLTNITSINAFGNRLTHISDDIGNLTFLTRIDLQGPTNQLTSLPATLSNLSSLRILNVQDNQLTQFPNQINTLSGLTILNLQYNNISGTIAASISGATSLSSLGLDHNRIQTLPENLFLLPSLTSITLNHNSLETLPLSFSGFTNRYTSQIGTKAYPSFDDELQVTIGRVIDLSHNDFSRQGLPANIHEWGLGNGYMGYDLRYNGLVRLPNTIGSGTNATWKQLLLGNNQLGNGNNPNPLPSSMSGFTNLELLDLQSNPAIGVMPEMFASGSKIQTLKIGGAGITQLPESIRYLKNLSELNLTKNALTTLPSSMSDLTALQRLYLSENSFTSIPEVIANMSSLNTLDISKNLSLNIIANNFDLLHDRLDYLDLSETNLGDISRMYRSTNGSPTRSYSYSGWTFSDGEFRQVQITKTP